MSYLKQSVYNIKCDSCGTLCDQESWFSDKDELNLWSETKEWITLGRRHYCPNCYTRDDNDNIVIKEINQSTKKYKQ